MDRTQRWWVIWVLLMLARGPVSAEQATVEPPADDWHWHKPVLLERVVLNRGDNIVFVPFGAYWVEGKPHLVALEVAEAPAFSTYREESPGRWKKVLSRMPDDLEAMPMVFTAGRRILLASSADSNKRIVLTNLLDSSEGAIEACRTANDSVVLNAIADGKRIDLTFYEQADEQFEVKLTRSTDGGKTWLRQPITIGKVATHKRLVGLPLYRLPDGRMGQFVADTDKGHTLLFQSEDDGKTWKARRFELEDKQQDAELRLPTRLVRHGKRWSLFYLAGINNMRQGAYYVAHSQDAGATWSKGIRLSELGKLEREAATFTPAARAGDRIAFTFFQEIDSEGREYLGNLLVGNTATGAPKKIDQNKFYLVPPLLNTVSAAPDGKRMIIASSIGMGGKRPSTHYLAVQAYAANPPSAGITPAAPATQPAARPKPEPTDAETRARVAQLIDQLGVNSFAKREAAFEELTKLGKLAEPQLRAALKSADPEVHDRAQRLIDKLEGNSHKHDEEFVEGPASPIR